MNPIISEEPREHWGGSAVSSYEEPVIKIRDLSRAFENVHAVQGVSFDIYRGQVVGFIGANGAGKTTTMRMMATLELPTSGTVEVCGKNVVYFPSEVRKKIGWMPDSYGTYHYMTVYEYLDFYGRAYGFSAEERRLRIEDVMDFAELTVISDRPMNTLSKGMGQRLCFGRTLVHDPEVLILDEPAAGLDPKARREFKNLIRILASRGKTIFISSHILSELAEMCDTFVFIDKGKIVYHGSSEGLKNHDGDLSVVDIRTVDSPEPLIRWLEMNQGWEFKEENRDGVVATFHSTEPEPIAEELRRMVYDGIRIVEFHRRAQRLEDAFVAMVKKVDEEEQK